MRSIGHSETAICDLRTLRLTGRRLQPVQECAGLGGSQVRVTLPLCATDRLEAMDRAGRSRLGVIEMNPLDVMWVGLDGGLGSVLRWGQTYRRRALSRRLSAPHIPDQRLGCLRHRLPVRAARDRLAQPLRHGPESRRSDRDTWRPHDIQHTATRLRRDGRKETRDSCRALSSAISRSLYAGRRLGVALAGAHS